jgi:glycosyltransferase involved in cell wall biosynthesis
MTDNTCIFTIVSRNYLHYARTLMDSLETHAPGAHRLVGLCDDPDGIDIASENFSVLPMKELSIPDIDKFIFRYTILELNTAIKPHIISHLFQQGYSKVIYFDPDIRVYRSLSGMLELLDDHQMLLTPHLTGPLDDEKLPSELNILVSGTYNLGYIGLRNTPDMQQFAHWWEDKLHTDCVVDLERGLFVDQKWVDLAPGMYPGVYINRNPGWNTAYWNLKHRQVDADGDSYTVNGQPLVFFHFSGFSGGATLLSKHQDRFTKKSAGHAVEQLCADYAEALLRNGEAEVGSISYAYGFFADGTPIPDFARYIYREDYDWENSTDDPYEPEGCANYLGYLNEPLTLRGSYLPWVTRLGHKLYQARPDLQQAFPDLTGEQGKRFADWYVHSVAEQAGFDDCFIEPVRHALSQLGNDEQPAGIAQRSRRWLNRTLYRVAWRYRHLVRPLVPAALRQKLHVRLVERLAPPSPPADTAETASHGLVGRGDKDPARPWGVNLYGYLHAESGIGQSARSNIHNLQAAGVPLAVVDFRKGNISRMEATIPADLATEPRHNINLFHVNADQTESAIEHLGGSVLAGCYNIGYWAWELSEFPDKWLSALQLLDEIWVPSEFCREAIAAKADIPVVCMPHSIAAERPAPTASRRQFKLPESATVFLTMYDALSVPERKNPEAAINAFLKARESEEIDAHLAIKVSNLDQTPDHGSSLRALAKASGHITLIEGYLDRSAVFQLIQSCDAFLSLHRSEGFGLGLAEAMLLGKVAIATDWSGNRQFMNASNSLLIPSELVPLTRDYGPYAAGQSWAEPDAEQAVDAILRCCREPDLRRALGERARETIATEFSEAAVGARILARLQAIAQETEGLSKAG